jgi:hypothetical protein
MFVQLMNGSNEYTKSGSLQEKKDYRSCSDVSLFQRSVLAQMVAYNYNQQINPKYIVPSPPVAPQENLAAKYAAEAEESAREARAQAAQARALESQ